MPYSTFIQVFEALGDAIRAKESSSLPIPLYEMPERIKALSREFDIYGYGRTAWLAKAARFVDTTGMTDMSYMFYNCRDSTIHFSIDLSGWDTSSVTNMESMFHNCYALTLNIANLNTSSVTNMRALFSSCTATIFGLSSWDTSSVTDMGGMFNGYGWNTQANELNLSGWDTSSVTNMSGLFYNCYASSIDLSGWDTSSVTDMGDMFSLHSSPKIKIWVPSSFVSTNVVWDGNKPFNGSQTLNAADVYTDATNAATQGWGTINSKFTMHYNSTYQDFLDA